jgi:hypothetical protein
MTNSLDPVKHDAFNFYVAILPGGGGDQHRGEVP